MRRILSKFWTDDDGFIISVEMLFICVILVIGLVAGFTALRQGIVTELAAVGNAVANLDEGYTINGLSSPGGTSDSTSITHTPVTNVTISINPPASQPPVVTTPPAGNGPPGASTP